MKLAPQCTRCPSLVASRRKIVWGTWLQNQHPNPDPCVMFIGEAPGWNEDIEGEPFVGMTGVEVREALWRVGLAPYVYLTNVVKCHPEDDRDPTPDELRACAEWLRREVEELNPRLVITAGRYSSRWALGLGEGEFTMEMVSGIPYHSPVLNRVVLPMTHPAAGFHSQREMCAVMNAFRVAGELWHDMMAGDEQAKYLDGINVWEGVS